MAEELGVQMRIDVLVVGNVVAGIDLGQGVHRIQPDRTHAQRVQAVQFFRDSIEVADAIPVGVEATPGVYQIYDRCLPPRCAGWLRILRRACLQPDRRDKQPGEDCRHA